MSHINTSNGNFGEGKISSLIMSQAVPLTMAQLVQVIYNVVDRMYIGHMPGDAAGVALTGVGVTFPLITLVAAFTNLFATGGAPLCAIARGQGDNKKAKNIEAQTFTMQILVGLAIMCLLYIVKKPALYLLGASDITYGYANSYISIYLIGTVFMMVGTGLIFRDSRRLVCSQQCLVRRLILFLTRYLYLCWDLVYGGLQLQQLFRSSVQLVLLHVFYLAGRLLYISQWQIC